MEYVGGGVDYNSGSYNVRFDAGVTNSSFIVMINDDNILETHEIFTLSVDLISLPSGVTFDHLNSARVIILANDGECT